MEQLKSQMLLMFGIRELLNLVSHFNKHVVQEGHKYLGNNIVEYTKNAMKFFQGNQNLLKLTDSGNYVIRALFEGHKAG